MFCRMEEHFVLNEEKRTLEAKLTETVECYFQINRGEFSDFVLTVQEKLMSLVSSDALVSRKNHCSHKY